MKTKIGFKALPFNADKYPFPVKPVQDYRFIAMNKDSTQNDVSLFIGTLLNFNHIDKIANILNILRYDQQLAFCGGIQFEHEGIVIGPSCCADFDQWKNILKSLRKKEGVDMGHNPDPWFEYKGDQIILWGDEHWDWVKNLPSITFHQSDIYGITQRVTKDLNDFMVHVKEWALRHCKKKPNLLTRRIRKFLLFPEQLKEL